jgi:hypothetical protein
MFSDFVTCGIVSGMTNDMTCDRYEHRQISVHVVLYYISEFGRFLINVGVYWLL